MSSLKDLLDICLAIRGIQTIWKAPVCRPLRGLLDHINLTRFMKASLQSLIPLHKINLIAEDETKRTGSKVHSQPLWGAQVREGGVVWHKKTTRVWWITKCPELTLKGYGFFPFRSGNSLSEESSYRKQMVHWLLGVLLNSEIVLKFYV